MVVQNYTTPSNQLEKIDKTLTLKSTEESGNSDKNHRPTGRVIDLSARRAGVSPMTYSKGRRIIDNAPEEMKENKKRQELVNAARIYFTISYRQF